MDGVYVQCPATHPETGQQCVRLANTHDEHQTARFGDLNNRRWSDE